MKRLVLMLHDWHAFAGFNFPQRRSPSRHASGTIEYLHQLYIYHRRTNFLPSFRTSRSSPLAAVAYFNLGGLKSLRRGEVQPRDEGSFERARIRRGEDLSVEDLGVVDGQEDDGRDGISIIKGAFKFLKGRGQIFDIVDSHVVLIHPRRSAHQKVVDFVYAVLLARGLRILFPMQNAVRARRRRGFIKKRGGAEVGVKSSRERVVQPADRDFALVTLVTGGGVGCGWRGE